MFPTHRIPSCVVCVCVCVQVCVVGEGVCEDFVLCVHGFRMRVRTCVHTHAHTHTHTHTHVHTHTTTHIHAHTTSHTYRLRNFSDFFDNRSLQPCFRQETHLPGSTHTHTHTHTSNTHTARLHAQGDTHHTSHTRTHTRTRALHTHTHMRTHRPLRPLITPHTSAAIPTTHLKNKQQVSETTQQNETGYGHRM